MNSALNRASKAEERLEMTCTQERFLNDVAKHEMTVVLDNGLHRHIQFSRPNSSIYLFNLVTWPGYLAISGDCDAYIFRRLTDMFEFFRGDRINTGYWAEKCTASSKHGKLRTFSEDRFRESVRADLNGLISFMSLSQAKKVVTAAHEELLDTTPYDTREAVELAQDFQCPVNEDHPFTEFYEHDLEEYSFGFTWSCRAIQWGIRQYDDHKAALERAA